MARTKGQDTRSMPSSHASRSAVLTELTERNLQSPGLSRTTRRVLDLGLDAITYGTAWAWVEAGLHFPSDTLVGISLANFNGALFDDAFLGLATGRAGPALSLIPLRHGAALQVRLQL